MSFIPYFVPRENNKALQGEKSSEAARKDWHLIGVFGKLLKRAVGRKRKKGAPERFCDGNQQPTNNKRTQE